MSTEINQLSLNPTAIARGLGVVALLLVLASTGGQFSSYFLGHDHLKGMVPLFYVDAELNIPTYFSVLLMLFAALLLAAIAVLTKKHGMPHASKWAIMSFGFLFMAYDESSQVHEKVSRPARALLGNSSFLSYEFVWVFPAIALVFVLGLVFLRFVLHLPAPTRMRFLTAATLYVGGAVGVEFIGGHHALVHGMQNWTYSMIATVEEGLELAGLIVFIWALLRYFAESYKEVEFRFTT